jgi:hypothetical protein
MAALVIYPAARGAPSWIAAALGVGALFALGFAAVLRVAQFVPIALVAFAAEYALLLAGRADIDAMAPFVAGGLVLSAELANLAVSIGTLDFDRAVFWRVVGRTIVVGSAAVLAGALMLAFASLGPARGIGLDLLGIAAALAAMGMVAVAARR